jgi:hypothetical protein
MRGNYAKCDLCRKSGKKDRKFWHHIGNFHTIKILICERCYQTRVYTSGDPQGEAEKIYRLLPEIQARINQRFIKRGSL